MADPSAPHVEPHGATGAGPLPGPPATFLHGRRTSWSASPAVVREHVGAVLGEPVTGWRDRAGGMSVGLAAVVGGSTRRVFVKALDGTQNPAGMEMYRREAATAAVLPTSPVVPRLLSGAEVTTPTGRWVVNVFEAVPGDPPTHPWRHQDLVRVLDAWAGLTPALHVVRTDDAPAIGAFLERSRAVLADHDDPWHLLLRPWAGRLDTALGAVDGDPEHPAVLGHGDLRADNLLLAEPGQVADHPGVWFVDWAQPAPAAPWADPAILFTDVLASGADLADGGDCDVEQLWRTHPLTAEVDVELLRGTVAALAAALHLGSRRPPSPLFAHQRGWERAMANGLRPYLTRQA